MAAPKHSSPSIDAGPQCECRLRREPEAAPLADTFNLTPRELEVLLWVSRGKTNRDIGDILGLSPRTVNKHLEHIYEKLGVETRTAAAAMAMRGGFSPSADLAAGASGPTRR